MELGDPSATPGENLDFPSFPATNPDRPTGRPHAGELPRIAMRRTDRPLLVAIAHSWQAAPIPDSVG